MARAATFLGLPIREESSIGSASGPGPDARLVEPPTVERLIGGHYRRWLPVAGLWFALAFLIAFGIYVSSVGQDRVYGLGRALHATIPHFLAWTLLSPALYRALYKVVEGARRTLAAAMLAAWSAIAIALSTLFTYLGVAFRDGTAPDAIGLFATFVAPPFGPAYQAMNATILLFALAAFGVLLAARQRAQALWLADQASFRDARQQAQIAESRLQALQARINPHFLLNSLNAIAGFVQSGRRDDAFDAVARLGTLLRTVLSHGDTPRVSVGEELDFADSYMQLLKMRFGARFSYKITAADSLRPKRVPALVVQPLIENAIRHGMQDQRPLCVEVRAYQQGLEVVIEVDDDGSGLASGSLPEPPEGHGLSNVEERLRLVHGAGAKLELEARLPAGTRARLRFTASG